MNENLDAITELVAQLPSTVNLTLTIKDPQGALKKPTFYDYDSKIWDKHGNCWPVRVSEQTDKSFVLNEYKKLYPNHYPGFVTNSHSLNLVCLDLDALKDEYGIKENYSIEQIAEDRKMANYYLDKFKDQTYCEYSASKKGIHIYFLSAHKPIDKHLHGQRKAIENFNSISQPKAKFVIITGNILSTTLNLALIYGHWDDYLPSSEPPKSISISKATEIRPLEEVKEFISLIPSPQNLTGKEWRDIGFALISCYGLDALDIFEYWSYKDGYKHNDSYTGKTSQEWYRYACNKESPSDTNITMATLYKRVKDANPAKYKALCKKFIKYTIPVKTHHAIKLQKNLRELLLMKGQHLVFEDEYVNEKGKRVIPPTPYTMENYLDYMGLEVTFDVIIQEIKIKGYEHQTLEDFITDLRAGLSSVGSHWGSELLRATFLSFARSNKVNPYKEWIESIPWDGHPRLAKLADQIPVVKESKEHLLPFLTHWLRQSIWAFYSEYPPALDKMLVLVGDQGTGKTEFFQTLLPKRMLKDYFSSGITYNSLSADSLKAVTDPIIAELGEIEGTFKKSSIESIKNLMSQKVDKFRIPYDRMQTKRDRHTIFCATANTSEFLRDMTGSRRFMAFELEKGKRCSIYHPVNPQQVWAELLAEFEKEGIIPLSNESIKINEELNNKFTLQSELEELFVSQYVNNTTDVKRISKKETLDKLFSYPLTPHTRSHRNELTTIVKKYGFRIKKQINGIVYYWLPSGL